MTETLAESITRTPDEMRLYQQERAILETTELICELMAQKGINKTGLAGRLGRTKGYITQLLNGNANMTLRTISDVFWALDSSIHLAAGPITLGAAWGDPFGGESWAVLASPVRWGGDESGTDHREDEYALPCERRSGFAKASDKGLHLAA